MNISTQRTGPASFWFGDRLSFVEITCLKSFIDLRMPFTLYTYDEIENVPAGVRIEDAANIVPRAKLFKNKERDSFAPFSDYFRYKMLQQTSYFWVDTDALALSSFPNNEPYLFAPHHRVIANGILSLPPDSEVLTALVDACENPSPDLPWLRRNSSQRLRELSDHFDVSDLPYKALGPLALTWLLNHHGKADNAQPQQMYYPFDPRHMFAKARRLMPLVPQSSVSIHLYGSAVRRRLRELQLTTPPEGTLLHALCRRQGISPDEYPLERDPQPKRSPSD